MNRPLIKVTLEQLQKAPWNYKTDGRPELIEKLVKSATYQKSIGVIAVRELGKNKYEIIDGNHRLDALKQLGVDEVTVENFGKISKAEAVVISKQRNMIWFEDDTVKFAEVFKEAVLNEFTIDELEQMLPLSKVELENYSKLLDFDWSIYDKNLEDDQVDQDEEKILRIILNKEEQKIWAEWITKIEKEFKLVTPNAILIKTIELAQKYFE
jgi:ParB family chromosome partitioning protein